MKFAVHALMVVTMVFATLSGCLAAPGERAAAAQVPGELFYQGDEASRRSVKLPVRTEAVWRIMLLDEVISYRNDRKATVTFSLPEAIRQQVTAAELVVNAYNDDRTYARTVWFEVNGAGGYLGARQGAPGQYGGQGVLRQGEQKELRYDLAEVPIAIGGGTEPVDFQDILLRPGPHTLSCWISTYAQYGPGSTVSVELILRSGSKAEADR